MKLLKGHVELDFDFIVPAHIDSLDKLCQNHLFRFKCTVVVHIGPADQLGVLLPCRTLTVSARSVSYSSCLSSGVERYIAVVRRSFLHNLLCTLEQVFVDDLKLRYQIRFTITIADYTGINLILDNAVD